MPRSLTTKFMATTTVALSCASLTQPAFAQTGFWNFETPPINPLAITPDGSRLLACNTADNRLEVFLLTPTGMLKAGSVAVGLDPVSVRARSNTEAWVVNHVSDSVSIVDLAAMNVRATIDVGDEPTDVVFAGAPPRAFICISQLNQVRIVDPITLAPVGSPLTIEGEDPRALATDGTSVYAAIFESGNNTTVLPQTTVSNAALNPYPGDPNPPPNAGTLFSPAITAVNPPAVSLIVRKVGSNWVDDNTAAGLNWNAAVTWGMHDHDVAVINANTLAVSYITGLMNLNMNLATRPGGGITVIGTEALNHKRFEPNARGVFLRVLGVNVPAGSTVDLNPHLNYSTGTVPQPTRDLSIGDPRGIAWRPDGLRAYITGMGSNNVIITDGALARVANINVGQGPVAVSYDGPRSRAYVLNRFDGTISTIDDNSLTVTGSVSMYDPTPTVIRLGRPQLYDTHKTSGLGHMACASCHIDARMDQLAWDLGDPQGATVPVPNDICQGANIIPGICGNFHPMKGPMTTQTLIGIIGTGVLHWRGDRTNLAAFNPAFVGLMGDDTQLTAQEMSDFTAFISTIHFPPQPNRNFDNSLKTSFANGGNPVTGENFFMTVTIDGGVLTCNNCHSVPTGTSGLITPAMALQETQSIKIPQLRNLYKKTGLLKSGPGVMNNNRGFGFTHDGNVDTLFSFLQFSGFNFAAGAAGDQQRRDVEAFLHSFPSDTHAAVGVQTTVSNGAAPPPSQQALLNDMLAQANAGNVGLVVKGRSAGEQRGWVYTGGGVFQSDRAGQTIASSALIALASRGSELTWTVVPIGTQLRLGIDRDADGSLDRTELDACSDPANPLETPLNVCIADTDASHTVDVNDLLAVISSWGQTGPPGVLPADVASNCGDGVIDVNDLLAIVSMWGACP